MPSLIGIGARGTGMTSANMAWPGGISAGQQAALFLVLDPSDTPSPPGDWNYVTSIARTTGARQESVWLFERVVGASESTFAVTAGRGVMGFIAVVSGAIIGAYLGNQTGSTTSNFQTGNMTSAVNNSLVMGFLTAWIEDTLPAPSVTHGPFGTGIATQLDELRADTNYSSNTRKLAVVTGMAPTAGLDAFIYDMSPVTHEGHSSIIVEFAIQEGVGDSDGSASVVGTGKSTAVGAGSSAGVAGVTAVGAGVKPAVGSASGTSTVAAVGSGLTTGQAVGDARGTSTAAAVATNRQGTGSAAGVATATAIVITPVVSVPPGASDLERWVPIVLDFDVPPGFDATVIVRLGGVKGIWNAAYAEGLVGATNSDNAFMPMYRNRSTVTETGDDIVGRHLTIELEPNGGWYRRDITLLLIVSREPDVGVAPAEGLIDDHARTARRTPITLEFDAPPDMKATVLGIMGDGSAHWMGIYSEHMTDSSTRFSPLFDQRSTVNISGAITRHFEMSLLPNAGWPEEIDQLVLLPIVGVELEE